ncbi:MAG: hypothetical protein J6Y17_02800 [Elusimicrobiaceae bacterium]|nr:hypothetical protein [Elusimicrobiaceae bacterium]
MFEKEKICKNCGRVGKEKKQVRGTLSMELSLWILGLILLIIPPLGGLILIFALFYSLYRLVAPKAVICPSCKLENSMIPMDSPMGQKLLQEFKDKQDD